MVLSSLRPEVSLVDFLESQARRESTRGLVARTAAALALMAVGLGPVSWAKPIAVALSIAYFSYAAWGLLDRARSHSMNSGRAVTVRYLNVLCAMFVGLGVLAGIALLMAIGFTLLGSPWVL